MSLVDEIAFLLGEQAAPGMPPYPGSWVKRESLPNGLDAARSLDDIAYHSETRGDGYGWNRGLTSCNVQYWVRVEGDDTSATRSVEVK